MENKRKWIELLWVTEKLQRFYENRGTEAERNDIENWDLEKNNKPDLKVLKPDFETEQVWCEIKKELLLKETPVSKPKVITLLRYKYIAVASVILFMGVFLYKQSPQYVTLTVKPGEIAKLFVLPDSSKVWLNSATSLRYQKKFVKNRNVEIDGEAYFEVFKNKQSPFKIKFKDNQLRVTGTKFTVSSYKNDTKTVVAVKEGCVEVYNTRVDTTALVKNNKLIIDHIANKQQKADAPFAETNEWKEGRLVFNRTPLYKVLKILERRYNVSFVIEATKNLDNLLTLHYSSNTELNEILNGITILTKIKYEEIKKNRIKIKNN